VRRAIFALLSTAAGTVLLVGAKGGLSHPATGSVPLAEEQSPASPAPSAARPSSPPRPGISSPATAAGNTTAAPVPTRKATGTKPAANPGGGMRNGTWNGDPEFNEFGNVELAIVVSGGKITDVKVLDYPQDHSRSVQINRSALPKLRSEALAAQNSFIDTVTGATVTSEGYRQSLQAAIDRARG
jgi:uncharacterized protein with FMN-binding domain